MSAIQSIQLVAREFRRQVITFFFFTLLVILSILHYNCSFKLEQMAILRASDFFRTHDESVLLNELKTYASASQVDLLKESIDRFQEQADIVIEVE